MLDAGIAFFFKWLALSGKIVGLYREEHLEIPYEALREALINALCHRNYEQYNICIGIAIYDDRIEIESPGKFPPQITPENIKLEHGSFPHNPIMADFLFKTTFWKAGAPVQGVLSMLVKPKTFPNRHGKREQDMLY